MLALYDYISTPRTPLYLFRLVLNSNLNLSLVSLGYHPSVIKAPWLLIWILLSEILVQDTLSPSPSSSSPTPISPREFYRVSLPRRFYWRGPSSHGGKHRVYRVCVCVSLGVPRVHRRVLRVPRVFPSLPLGFEVNPRDRATHGVLDLIIWYQQLLVTADLTPHPPDFVSRKFSKKSPKIAPNCLLTDL